MKFNTTDTVINVVIGVGVALGSWALLKSEGIGIAWYLVLWWAACGTFGAFLADWFFEKAQQRFRQKE